ncbi:hypothetical protein [Luteolibacter soli]|uniref:Uncharacterized protein n=1 Tax=Luteolibacter soli TaxID=3135280 RepID=A0ABU9AYA3_9BACT
MADDALNPYAPPAEEVVSSEVVGGVWRVEADYLVVREGTVLPKVDLDGRGMGGHLTPVAMKLPVPMDGKRLAIVVIAGLPMVGYMIYQATRGARVSPLWMIAIAVGTQVLCQFLFRGVKVRTAPAHVYGYISIPAIRSITRRDQIRRRLTWALLAPVFVIFPLVVAYPLMTRRYDQILEVAKWAGGIVAVSLVLLLAVAIWKEADKGWRCPRFSDGWVWIKGLGPKALAGLGAQAVGYVPVPVKKRVFKIRLDRMPTSFWKEVHGGGPLGTLRSWMHRSRVKGRPVEQTVFHWSEREWLSPEKADPDLLAAWRSEIAGTPLADWPMVYAEHQTLATGCHGVTELIFLSPDGCHAAIPSITRAVIDRKLKETRELNFRSFTTDGRIIATASNQPAGPLPSELEFEVVRGKPMEIAHVHFQRTSREHLVTVTAEELRRNEEREMDLVYETREAAGIYGPIEEMEFFRP